MSTISIVLEDVTFLKFISNIFVQSHGYPQKIIQVIDDHDLVENPPIGHC